MQLFDNSYFFCLCSPIIAKYQLAYNQIQSYSIGTMDFEKLAQIIPKLSRTWTVADTQKWIQFTGLEILSSKFRTFFLSQKTQASMEVAFTP